jgi:hypothetical protein
MISSGIKRGLAATAISALAVTGIPALASSANAAVGDNFTVTYTGPALNGGDEGALVIIRAEDGEITPNLIKAVGTTGTATGSEDTGDQNVQVLSASGPVNDPANSAFEFIQVRVAVTTTNSGDTANFRLFEDDSTTNNTLEASEARQAVSLSTAGALSKIVVAPATQSTPENIESGNYTVTLKDAAGRTTQLRAGESVVITPDAPVAVTETGTDTAAQDSSFTSDELVRGTDSFTADPNGAAVGTYSIALNSAAYTGENTSAQLVVTDAANLAAGDIDIVTAADSWNGPGDGTDNGTTFVRVDQNTIRFDINAANSEAGSNVQLTVDGNGVTFAGQDQATYSTTLDGAGNGSITVTVDAATIQEGDDFDVDINGFGQTLTFQRAAEASIDGASATYFCQDDATCTVTAVVLDQFGNPVTTGEVEARRTGPQNVDTTPQRKPVGPDGTVDFTFADANPIDGGTDTVQFDYFLDQFDNTSEDTDASTTIKYSATGQGNDYVIGLDGDNTEAATYEPTDQAIVPLADAFANDTTDPRDEDATISITGGEAGQAVTLSVDNGALILAPNEADLSEGSASVEATLNGGGALQAGYRVIGTKSGLVTLTVDSAGRTETAQLTVSAQDDSTTARNVTVSGPAEVESGTTQIQYVAVITDAFGNPVSGVTVGQLNIQVTGPAVFQDSDAVSDANGQIHLNVRVDSGAEGVVTIRVQGMFSQFGAQADRLTTASTTDDAQGLPASSDVATASTTVNPAVVPDKVSAELTLKGYSEKKIDVLFANADSQAAGATVKLFKSVNGAWKRVGLGTLNANGNYHFRVADKNGKKVTQYKATCSATARTLKGEGTKGLR